MWSEWGRTTRFLNSTRIAFARERALWQNLEIADRSAARIHTASGLARYRVSLDDHVSALDDEQLLHGAILVYSYTLAESQVADFLRLDTRDLGGIEDWAGRLLRRIGRTWGDVLDGKAGLVEVAVVRNTLAHGVRRMDQRGINRMTAAGSAFGWAVGEPVEVSADGLRLYRDRLRSLLRLAFPTPPGAPRAT
jgi:GAF domain-containing protein